MLSRNNQQEAQKKLLQQLPHYGLRKLGAYGLASVLLGLSFYFQSTPVQAETVKSVTNSDASQTTVDPANSAQQLQTNRSVALRANQSTTSDDKANGGVYTNPADPQKQTSLTPVGSTTINSGDQLSFDFQSNDFTKGDVFKIVFPTSDDHFKGQGTYSVTAPSDTGITVTNNNGDADHDQQAVITDTMDRDGSFYQRLTLRTSNNFSRQYTFSVTELMTAR